MALARDLSSHVGHETELQRCVLIRDRLIQEGLYDGASSPLRNDLSPLNQWRIAPDPLLLSPGQIEFFQALGMHLLAFYRGLNNLYFESIRGTQPAWVAEYLDQGKPESLVAYARMKRFRDSLPAVIRPDIIPTDDGMLITELDSVPGGIGLTACLALIYGQGATGNAQWEDEKRPYEIVGGADGMIRGFAAMLRALPSQGKPMTGCAAIVVSEEAKDYKPEMQWLAGKLREYGVKAWCVDPREVRFTEAGLSIPTETGERPVEILYRFFELFDLKNVPKAELIMYSVKKARTTATPPFKPALEEKLGFALLHHPRLKPFWQEELGIDTFELLARLMPKTWILDPRPLPPTAIIPDLSVGGRAVADWQDLARASQKERRLVVKPSGFSKMAWGSRGVSIGHDMPQNEWSAAIDRALMSFQTTPYVLQKFHKGRQFESAYYDERKGDVVPMPGRARLCPYYFVTEGRAELAGVLATICPLDKKVIHGMRDAIMVPCAVAKSRDE